MGSAQDLVANLPNEQESEEDFPDLSLSACSSNNSASSLLDPEAYPLTTRRIQYQREKGSRTTSAALRTRLGAASSLYQYFCSCTPRICFRWFNVVIIGSLLLLFAVLIHLSSESAQFVQSALQRPGPPPVWSKFPLFQRYYAGLKTLVPARDNVPETPSTPQDYSPPDSPFPQPSAYRPFPVDNDIVECFLDSERFLKVPDILAYRGIPMGMPDAAMGSMNLIGLDGDVCFDRNTKLSAYGLVSNDSNRIESEGGEGLDYRNVDWSQAQQRCLQSNIARFEHYVTTPTTSAFGSVKRNTPNLKNPSLFARQNTANQESSQETPLNPRKAIIVRTWHQYQYDEEDIMFLRSIVSELALKTGGEYTVHILIDVKDSDVPIWADEQLYARVLNDALPREFAGLGILWSVQQMSLIYGNLPENKFRGLPLHGSYRSLYMPLTWFAHQHPEYSEFWQFELDMRYTGHLYELLSKATSWAAVQPRKYLWERNARFYIPAEHGTWEDFDQLVRFQSLHGSSSLAVNSRSENSGKWQASHHVPGTEGHETHAESPVWGPLSPLNTALDNSTIIHPPWGPDQDNNVWGVGESADLILFNPIFDPQGTHWLLADDTTGYIQPLALQPYNTGRKASSSARNRLETSHTAAIPRRAAVTTFGAYSRRLLRQLHHEMVDSGRHMFTEMFPASVALHYGFKAVYIPHEVLYDRAWPAGFMANTFNSGRNGETGGNSLSPFSVEREHNFRGASWYYNAEFAERLWKGWIGVDQSDEEKEQELREGPMCLRSVLLHPVKHVF